MLYEPLSLQAISGGNSVDVIRFTVADLGVVAAAVIIGSRALYVIEGLRGLGGRPMMRRSNKCSGGRYNGDVDSAVVQTLLLLLVVSLFSFI